MLEPPSRSSWAQPRPPIPQPGPRPVRFSGIRWFEISRLKQFAKSSWRISHRRRSRKMRNIWSTWDGSGRAAGQLLLRPWAPGQAFERDLGNLEEWSQAMRLGHGAFPGSGWFWCPTDSMDGGLAGTWRGIFICLWLFMTVYVFGALLSRNTACDILWPIYQAHIISLSEDVWSMFSTGVNIVNMLGKWIGWLFHVGVWFQLVCIIFSGVAQPQTVLDLQWYVGHCLAHHWVTLHSITMGTDESWDQQGLDTINVPFRKFQRTHITAEVHISYFHPMPHGKELTSLEHPWNHFHPWNSWRFMGPGAPGMVFHHWQRIPQWLSPAVLSDFQVAKFATGECGGMTACRSWKRKSWSCPFLYVTCTVADEVDGPSGFNGFQWGYVEIEDLRYQTQRVLCSIVMCSLSDWCGGPRLWPRPWWLHGLSSKERWPGILLRIALSSFQWEALRATLCLGKRTYCSWKLVNLQTHLVYLQIHLVNQLKWKLINHDKSMCFTFPLTYLQFLEIKDLWIFWILLWRFGGGHLQAAWIIISFPIWGIFGGIAHFQTHLFYSLSFVGLLAMLRNTCKSKSEFQARKRVTCHLFQTGSAHRHVRY